MPEAPHEEVEAFCAAPRGGAFCFAVAHAVHDPVWSALLQAAWHPSRPTLRRDLLAVLGEVDPAAVRRLGEETGFVGEVAASVDAAMYWQEPREEDLLLRAPEVRAALRPIAAAALATETAQRWSDPVDLGALRWTVRYDERDDDRRAPPNPTGVLDRLRRWRADEVASTERAARERPRDPAANWSGSWWSIPVFAGLLDTTSPLPGRGPAALAWEEDGMGFGRADVREVVCRPDARVLEITGPDDWAALVRRHPLDVTAERRHDWYRTTGRDGTWLIPDWTAVAEEWDAVHVTVLGYLLTATRAVPVGDDTATVLAGWAPDTSWWLTDAARVAGPPESWWQDGFHPDPTIWHRGGPEA